MTLQSLKKTSGKDPPQIRPSSPTLPQCDCLLTDLPLKFLQSELVNETYIERIPLLRLDWLIDCFEQKKRLCWDPYILPIHFKKTPANLEETKEKSEINLKVSPSKAKGKLSDNILTTLTARRPSTCSSNSGDNDLIIEKLQRLADLYLVQGERIKNLAYKKAIANVKAYDKPITSGEEALSIPGVGGKIAGHVKVFSFIKF